MRMICRRRRLFHVVRHERLTGMHRDKLHLARRGGRIAGTGRWIGLGHVRPDGFVRDMAGGLACEDVRGRWTRGTDDPSQLGLNGHSDCVVCCVLSVCLFVCYCSD